MISRDFNRKIEVWTVTRASDGYGGYSVSEALLGNSWASLETMNAGQVNRAIGVETSDKVLKVTVRKRNDLQYRSDIHFIVYRGIKYNIIKSPVEDNLDKKFVVFYIAEADEWDISIPVQFTASVITVTDVGD